MRWGSDLRQLGKLVLFDGCLSTADWSEGVLVSRRSLHHALALVVRSVAAHTRRPFDVRLSVAHHIVGDVAAQTRLDRHDVLLVAL